MLCSLNLKYPENYDANNFAINAHIKNFVGTFSHSLIITAVIESAVSSVILDIER